MKVGKGHAPLLCLRLPTHAGPDVGVNRVRVFHRFGRIVGESYLRACFLSQLAGLSCDLGVGLVAGRVCIGVGQCRRIINAVADKRHPEAGELAMVLFERQEIRHGLAGVVAPAEGINHGYR